MNDDISANASDLESIVGLDGKDYMSVDRAVAVSGYTPAEIERLARTGHVLARIANERWYIDRESLDEYKRERDESLVGKNPGARAVCPENKPYVYSQGSGSLLPEIRKTVTDGASVPDVIAQSETRALEFRATTPPEKKVLIAQPFSLSVLASIGKATAAIATVVIVVSIGYSGVREQATYAVQPHTAALPAAAAVVVDRIGEFIENLFSPDVVFIRK